VIEDFHAIHLLPSQQFYGIFDGHLGNLASKFVSSTLYDTVANDLLRLDTADRDWKVLAKLRLIDAFEDVHARFLQAMRFIPDGPMDQSGTTATVMFVTPATIVIASLGDSRAVIATKTSSGILQAIQLTTDHIAAHPAEREFVERRGGFVKKAGGVDRVNGSLVVTRSIGDANLSPVLSQIPDVLSLTRGELVDMCGALADHESIVPCFVVLASDGLWDKITNQEAVSIFCFSYVLLRMSNTDCEHCSRLTW
jgi:protein phosphatase 1L